MGQGLFLLVLGIAAGLLLICLMRLVVVGQLWLLNLLLMLLLLHEVEVIGGVLIIAIADTPSMRLYLTLLLLLLLGGLCDASTVLTHTAHQVLPKHAGVRPRIIPRILLLLLLLVL